MEHSGSIIYFFPQLHAFHTKGLIDIQTLEILVIFMLVFFLGFMGVGRENWRGERKWIE